MRELIASEGMLVWTSSLFSASLLKLQPRPLPTRLEAPLPNLISPLRKINLFLFKIYTKSYYLI